MDAEINNQLVNDLKAEAYRLGFSLCGISAVFPVPGLATYQAWINRGGHADMHYLARPDALARRNNPALLLPGVKSIIVLGMAYSPAAISQATLGKPCGRIAAYAGQSDYHFSIPPLLEQLALWLQSQISQPIHWRACTDSTALLERGYALQAGLGWIGKNTCLISPGRGSYFLLAEILVDIELPVSTPITYDYCGNCNRCIEACPTHCIRSDRTLDAGRCISYLTIENKNAIPLDLRHQISDWVFGCDICQMVCPWNRFATPATSAATLQVDLTQHLTLTPEAFKNRFHLSPILRAKRHGYLRNLAIVLGNLHQSDHLPGLISVFQAEPEPLVRSHIAWALGKFNHPRARKALLDALACEKDPSVLTEVNLALHR